ncbi:resolvase [Halolactibacillus miurensis]|uniref:Resolvase n=1 Tax=Halolactibacillus miurensis TaxID=306541 RepID=A0A1I6U2D9_9BACI|nr:MULTISPECIES: recombinase family protein [Halolactibacillus]GEM05969.1 resolvase [Halolactibacillus miurensis]SFS95518.1 Site-specific DNA recombinase [Halolactibacillus miurensis]
MEYGYCRVSTNGQFAHGSSLQAQEEAVTKAGAKKIYKDVYTGTSKDRPNFQELLNVLSQGDTLIVTKLDRFARSTIEGTKIIKELFEKGVTVKILNLGTIENTPNGRLIFNIFMSFAEFERDMIMERTQEGKAIAKQRPDYKEGRPKKFKKAQIHHALDLLETHSYKQVEELTGISASTLTRAKRKRKQEINKYN